MAEKNGRDEARRFAEALEVLQVINEPIRSMVAGAPGVPATELRLPETVDGYDLLLEELFVNLFTVNGSNHPRWLDIARSRLPHEAEAVYAAKEAMYLWYQALCATRAYVLGGERSRGMCPSVERDRVLFRLSGVAGGVKRAFGRCRDRASSPVPIT